MEHAYGLPRWTVVQNPPANTGDARDVGFLFMGREDPLEEEMATHSSIFAKKIPWIEESGGLQSMGSQRAGHNWATEHAHISTYGYIKDNACF